jgi:hypothetical protein
MVEVTEVFLDQAEDGEGGVVAVATEIEADQVVENG